MPISVDKFMMFRNRLEKVYRHLSKQARKANISCYRVYDHDLPEFPFSIEFYGERLYVAEYKRRHGMIDDEHDVWISHCIEVIEDVLKIKASMIHVKMRQRKAGRQGQYQKTGEKKEEFEITENGLKFLVNLNDYLDTGLFLDHRITRQITRDISASKKVLNLFCYTGSFSVYAADGGPTEVVSVDLSNTYLSWAGRNMLINGFADEKKYKFIKADVLQFLPGIPAATFDVIIMDPPTFSNSKMMEDILDIQKDHVRMINECLRILNKKGVLLFSTNLRDFRLEIEAINSDMIKDITAATTPFDFAGRLHRKCYRIENS